MKKALIIFVTILLPLSGCKKDPKEDPEASPTGWMQSSEDIKAIPADISAYLLGGTFGDVPGAGALRSRVVLDDKFPPIGDQGRHGTCVVWAVGYYFKTALNAIENDWSANDLRNVANQTSPKDLWFAIPTDSKSPNCNGTHIDAAMLALINSGATSMSVKPYENMGNCAGTPTGSADNRIANYRRIAYKWDGEEMDMNVENLKRYLNAGRPIAFGARLGDRFMAWRGASVISGTDTYLKPNMQHTFHAMALTGYDDDLNAFRVINSWGTRWGDNGSIWVDYDFFVNNFAIFAFVAQNPNTKDKDEAPRPVTGPDLMAYFAEDYPATHPDDIASGRDRVFSYVVYNSGTENIASSRKWTLAYLYYDATDARNFRIIYDEFFTNEAPGISLPPGNYAPNPNSSSLEGGYFVNESLQPGDFYGERFEVAYPMPKITGDYYLVLFVDATDAIREVNEDNNFYFITAADGKPLKFVDGKVQNMPSRSSMKRLGMADRRPAPFADTETQTAVTPQNPNTYTPEELKAMLLHDYRTGAFQSKLKAFRDANPTPNVIRRKVK